MYKSIQACRGLAALQVVLFHLGGMLANPKYFGIPAFDALFHVGDSGVEFFFVLSGFIVTWAHRRDFGRPTALPTYVRKRLVRIYPAYWIIFLGVLLLAYAVPTLRTKVPDDLGTIVKSLLLVPQDPAVVGGTGAPVIVVAWSLQYELVFYALVAAAIVNRVLALLAVLAIAGTTLFCLKGCGFPGSFFGRDLLALFAFGAGVAWLTARIGRISRPWPLVLAALFAYVLVLALDLPSPAIALPGSRPISYGLVFSLLIAALVLAENSGLVLGAARPLQRLGDASYALYLIHFPLLSILFKLAVAAGLTGALGAAVVFCAALPATIAVALLFHQWIERPILRYLAPGAPRQGVVAGLS